MGQACLATLHGCAGGSRSLSRAAMPRDPDRPQWQGPCNLSALPGCANTLDLTTYGVSPAVKDCCARTMWTVGVMDEYSRYLWSGDRQVSVTVQRRLRACTSLRRRQSDSVSYIRMRRSCWNAAAGAGATVRAAQGVFNHTGQSQRPAMRRVEAAKLEQSAPHAEDDCITAISKHS